MQGNLQDAVKFFAQLEEFSAEIRRYYTGSANLSPFGNPKYRAVQGELLPDGAAGVAGAIIHYTAGPSAKSAVQTFCDPKSTSGRSAHVVIERGWPKDIKDRFGALLERCPMVQSLPAMPVQCRLPNAEGVHATWANRWAWGAELVSWGRLEPTNSAGPIVQACGARWQAFTADQVAALVTILGHLRTMCPTFLPSQVFTHEQVQTTVTPSCGGENKVDTGPILDVSEVRRGLRGPQEHAALVSTPPTSGKNDREAWALLRALGYWDGGPGAVSLAVFQFAMNLVVDGLMGPKSKAAIIARLRDRMGPDAQMAIDRCRSLS